MAPDSTKLMEHDMNNTPFLTEGDAARYLGLSPATLARWRSKGNQGPAFRKFGGAVRYSKVDIDMYAANAEVQR